MFLNRFAFASKCSKGDKNTNLPSLPQKVNSLPVRRLVLIRHLPVRLGLGLGLEREAVGR